MVITKEQFLAYEDVRLSGITNMFNVKVVNEMSGLDKRTIFEIMKTYGKLAKKYLKRR